MADESDEENIELLLTKIRLASRKPNKIDDAWALAQQSSDPVSAIFRAEGFAAWTPYHLALIESTKKSTSAGKSRRSKIIQRVRRASPAQTKEFAAKLAHAIQKDDKLSSKLSRWHASDMEQEGYNDEHSNAAQTASAPFEASIQETGPDMSSTTQTPAQTRTDNPMESSPFPRNTTPAFDDAATDPPVPPMWPQPDNSQDTYKRTEASLTQVTKLFPPDFASIIKRATYSRDENTKVAAITTMFPTVSPSDSELVKNKAAVRMVVRMTGERMAHYAFLLYGVHLESRGNARYLHIPNGGEVESDRMLVLRGCRMDMIRPVFGERMADAIAKSYLYVDDLKNGQQRTQSVLMCIERSVTEGGCFTLYLPHWEGSELVEYLYPLQNDM